jgi:putative tryptophan/tyrosine transport system substrate-binding protein
MTERPMGIDRRTLMGWLGGALAWPGLADAQPSKQHTIGILVLGNPDPTDFLATLREELAKVGYEDGRNARFEVRSAGGDASQLLTLAAELASLSVDVLVTYQTPATIAARDTTKTFPIVMVATGDPVPQGSSQASHVRAATSQATRRSPPK